MARFGLTGREWSIIAPLLPNKPRGVARSPSMFRDLPSAFIEA
jgi:hypothetical protein